MTQTSAAATIFVVDDHAPSAEALAENLQREGYAVRMFTHPEPVLAALEDEDVAVLVTDLRMDGMDGIELLRACRQRDATLPVIVVTAHGSIEKAVEATQAGAFAFLTKPIHLPALLVQVRNAVSMRTMSQVIRRGEAGTDRIIGHSSGLLHAIARADRAAVTDMTVLVTGESGTGKELIARRIHHRSPRAKGPFVAVNCGSIPDTLVEAELFGAAKGAFTGADRDREGLVEHANHGTLFLDEVGELSPLAQVRLLRFLQEGTIRRVGETRDRKVDVRVVAATHQDLQAGTFRSDLFYRLNVIPIELPPLRARGDDVLVLFGMALRETCARIGRPVPSLSSAAVGALRAWSWPGNVRELRNLADQMAVLAGSVVDLADLPPELREAHRDPDNVALPPGDFDLTGWLEGLEERALRRALERNDGVKARAAQSLGLERTAFRYKLKKHGIEE